MKRSSIAIVGAGRLGSALATSLRTAGYRISEIVSRRASSSARSLARSVGAGVTTSKSAVLDSEIVWFCVPDAQIANAADELSVRNWEEKIALHSSGVLSSDALGVLRGPGAAVASVHPLMTFVRGQDPDLKGVAFAIEGDPRAVRVGSGIARSLGGKSVRIQPCDKVAYHAFATMICPLLISLLAASEEAVALAGISARDARRRMLPIVRQTIANYEKLGPAKSFTGPIVRGDVETVRRHLGVLSAKPHVRDVYTALVRAALRNLPSRNAKEIREALRESASANPRVEVKSLLPQRSKKPAKNVKKSYSRSSPQWETHKSGPKALN